MSRSGSGTARRRRNTPSSSWTLGIKTCIKCNIEKKLEEFPREKRNKDGYMGTCKVCINAYNKSLGSKVSPPQRKRCNQCKVEKDIEEFGKSTWSQDGKDRTCKVCKYAYNRNNNLKR